MALSFVAVLLGSTFVFGTLLYTDSIAPGEEIVRRDVSVLVAPRPPSGAGEQGGSPGVRGEYLTTDQLRTISTLPGVAQADGVVVGYAAVVGADGKVAQGSGFGSRLTGTNWSGTPRVRLLSGRAPAAADEVAVETVAARSGRLQVGDDTRVLSSAGEQRAKVVGIFSHHPLTPDPSGSGPSVAFDTATAQRLLLRPGAFSEAEVAAQSGVDPEKLTASISGLLPADFQAANGARLAEEAQQNLAGDAETIQRVLLGFTMVALLIGALLIANTYSVLIERRNRELALLRAVGASRTQVRRVLLLEAAAVGVAGTICGIAAGTGLAALMVAYTASRDPSVDQGLVVTPRALATTVLAGVVVTILAAWVPARRGTRIPPVAALRTEAIATPSTLHRRNRAGQILALIAGLACVFGLTGSATVNLIAGVVGAFLLLMASVVLSPWLAAILVRLCRRVLPSSTASTHLAVENTLRSPRRTAATVSALLIGVALATGISIFTASITEVDRASMLRHLTATYVAANIGDGPVDAETQAKARSVPGVTRADAIRTDTLQINGRSIEVVAAIDPAAIGKTVRVLHTGRLDDLGKGVFVNAGLAEDRGWSMGSTITVRSAAGEAVKLPVTGLFEDAPLTGNTLLFSNGFADRHFRPSGADVLLIAGPAGDGLRQGLESALADRPDVRLFTKDEYVVDVTSDLSAFVWISTVMLGLSFLIALLGIVNTLALAVLERTREIGLLRAIGMRRRQIRAMIRRESVLISLAGALLGLAAGLVIGVTLQHLVLGQSFATIAIPVPTIGGVLLAMIVGGVLAATWPARRAARVDVLQALHAE
ncbi:ABC transporter permease [Nonomuraea sp. NPDC059007]|uniref:ABC transporter permease n=1 Tax=Nonomuraea sp. NPDC059007 TaxID=3346692 RepID=UPI003696F0AD